jgi:hypothetical protein
MRDLISEATHPSSFQLRRKLNLHGLRMTGMNGPSTPNRVIRSWEGPGTAGIIATTEDADKGQAIHDADKGRRQGTGYSRGHGLYWQASWHGIDDRVGIQTRDRLFTGQRGHELCWGTELMIEYASDRSRP